MKPKNLRTFRLPESGTGKQIASLKMFTNPSNFSMGMCSIINTFFLRKKCVLLNEYKYRIPRIIK